MFIKYQHIERFGTSEVEGILNGLCYIFPKLDGSNGSVWLEDNKIMCSSRKKVLTEDNNNRGFYQYNQSNKRIKDFLTKYPNYRLYGEWLIPHHITYYHTSAWYKFYVFDIIKEDGIYIPYKDYTNLLEKFRIDYIPLLEKIENPTIDKLIELAKQNKYLLRSQDKVGVGIVIKNYSFVNRFNRTTWAKIVLEEHIQKHKNKKPLLTNTIEEQAVETFLTDSVIQKVYSEIYTDHSFESKDIPRLLNTVYHEFVTEEIWQIIKKFKNPVINFNRLKAYVFNKIKQSLIYLSNKKQEIK